MVHRTKWLTALVILSLGVLVPAGPVLAQEDAGDIISGRGEFNNVGNRSAEFLTIGVSARAVALGGAYTAIADDITSLYWNPAGLGFLEGSEAFFTVVNLPLDVTLSYVGAGASILDGTAAIGGFAEVLNFGSLDVNTVEEPNGTGLQWSSFSFAGGVTWAQNFSDRFSAGFTVKGIYESIYDVSASAFAFDFGSNYHTTWRDRNIRLAFAVQNLGSSMQFTGSRLNLQIPPQDEPDDESATLEPRNAQYSTQKFGIPNAFKAALSYDLIARSWETGHSWLIAGEFSQPNNQDATFSAGTEYTVRLGDEGSTTAISARGGWYVQQDEEKLGDAANSDAILRGLSLGGGFTYDFLDFKATFDYAYRHMGRLDAEHFFSVRVGF
jgi:hypothetical protein